MDDLTSTLTLLFASHKADDMAKAIAAAMPAAEKWNFLRSLDEAYYFVPIYTMSVGWIEEHLDDQNSWDDDDHPKRRIVPGSEKAIFDVFAGWNIPDSIFEGMSYVRDDIVAHLEENKLIEQIPEEVTTGEQDDQPT